MERQPTYKKLLEEFLELMNTEYFVEVDRRLSLLNNEQEKDGNNENELISSDYFILHLLKFLSDYVDSATLYEIRKELYRNVHLLVNLIEELQLTKTKLNELLRKADVEYVISTTINYQVGVKYFIPALIDTLKESGKSL